jgi:tRNA threonylcarbamoyladenosine biosynthesis protein TsaE
MMAAEIELPDAATTDALGAALAQALVAARATRSLSIYLHGELGTGKTTLAQGLLRALGVSGTIRSPSYTLVEPYETALGQVLHVDLYRLQGARDVEALGLPDELAQSALLVVEWPARGRSESMAHSSGSGPALQAGGGSRCWRRLHSEAAH